MSNITPLQRLKLARELQQQFEALPNAQNARERLSIIKKIHDLRTQLGFTTNDNDQEPNQSNQSESVADSDKISEEDRAYIQSVIDEKVDFESNEPYAKLAEIAAKSAKQHDSDTENLLTKAINVMVEKLNSRLEEEKSHLSGFGVDIAE